jgi:hypothetical protein
MPILLFLGQQIIGKEKDQFTRNGVDAGHSDKKRKKKQKQKAQGYLGYCTDFLKRRHHPNIIFLQLQKKKRVIVRPFDSYLLTASQNMEVFPGILNVRI